MSYTTEHACLDIVYSQFSYIFELILMFRLGSDYVNFNRHREVWRVEINVTLPNGS